jgi:predicted amidohydrolase YtcJ
MSGPDLILHHGKVVTVDPQFSIAEALAIVGDRFLAVGSHADVEDLAGPETRRLHLNGRTVLPGIFDGHVHASSLGVNLGKVDLSEATSIDDVQRRIAAAAAEREPGEWIEASPQWHETSLAEHRLPTRRELDAAAPHHPVYVPRGTRFFAAANTAALRAAGYDRNTPDPPGGRLGRDAGGELDGFLENPLAFEPVRRLVPPLTPAGRDQALARAQRALNAVGITSAIDPALTAEDVRAYQHRWENGAMTVRTTGIIAPDRSVPLHSSAEDLLRFLDGWALTSGFGDDRFRIGPFKLWVDGFIETAWLKDCYANDPSFHGVQAVPRDVLLAVMRRANELDWQVALHVVGDAAIEMALEVFADVDRERSIAGRRWTLMHALFPTPRAMQLCKQLGVCVSIQQGFSYTYGETMVKLWGRERAAYATPHRRWLDAGFKPAGGSDVMPFNPFISWWSMVTRETKTAGILGAEYATTRREAIEMYTVNPPFLTFEERLKGSIERDKLADLVVLSADPLSCPTDEIKSIRPLATVVGGEVVYGQLEDL